jgi:hypothetical protein
LLLPGEEVEIIGSKVIIFNDEYPDGVLLNEDYITPDVAASEESRDTYFPRTEIKSNEFLYLVTIAPTVLIQEKEGLSLNILFLVRSLFGFGQQESLVV